jgi:hypothetical protein
MIVPGIEGGDDNGEQEPDYDYDERVTSIEDAAQFFDDGDYNGRREIQRLREQMSDSYQEWLSEAWMEHFESYKNSIVFRYGKENWSEADIAEILGLDEAAAEALENRGASPEDYMDAAEKVIEDGLDPWLNDAQENAQEEYYEDEHEEDWLRSQGLQFMSNISDQYEVSWPYWSSEGAGIESVADEFREAIGRKVNWSDSYHGGKREDNTYVVEPDTSLRPDDSDDAGLEFISPELPIDDMLSDLNKVKTWADQRGCYTSDAAKTGLHINVSVPGQDNNKLDYVKLALLLGDQYVLDQFGRLGNDYAKSAMVIIKDRISQRPEDAAALLQKMKTGLGELATKIIHSGVTSKYTSINTKSGSKGDYIEFRSPGGDWLNANFNKIETTLLRFVVALDAAMDPAKYRDEYQSELYKMLTGQSSGRTGSELKWDITSKAMVWYKDKRIAHGKEAFTPKQKPAFSTTVTAKTAKEAWEKAKPSPDANASEYKIEPSPTAGPDNDALLKIFSKYSAGEMSVAELSKDLEQRRAKRSKVKDTYAELKPGQSNYKIYQISDGRIVGTFYAADRAQAESEFTDWLMSPEAGGRDDFRYAPIDTPIQGPRTTPTTPVPGIIDIEPDVEQNFVPGSTQDIQQRRAAGGEFTGAWRVLDPEDREIYRFSGVGNNQSDANRVAMNWLRQNPGRMQAGVTVVPIMS